MGCGSKVTARDFAPSSRARSTIFPSTSWWARCTPSKLPALSDGGAEIGGNFFEFAENALMRVAHNLELQLQAVVRQPHVRGQRLVGLRVRQVVRRCG